MLNDGVINFWGDMLGINPDDIRRAIGSDALTPWTYARVERERQSDLKPRQTDIVGNQEMANKINELYNELNQKDKDLKEARESIRRLQGSVREFRRRAEDAELNASRIKESYNGLAERYNKQVVMNRGMRAELNALHKKVEYLLDRLRSEQDVTSSDNAYSNLTINDDTGEISKSTDKEVDALDISMDTAEEIIRRIQGM